MMLRRKTFLVSLSFTLCMALVIHSCSSNEYDFVDDDALALVSTETFGNLGYRTPLVDSVATSNDFLDFVESCDLFSDKMDEYISALSQKEKEELISNANNDDFVLKFIDCIDIEEEVLAISLAKRRLLDNTSFLRLNESEKSQLFDGCLVTRGHMLIKTRDGEGVTQQECEKAKKKAYDSAYDVFIRRLLLCDDLPDRDKYACQVATKLNYEAEKSQADTEYKRCMEKVKK